MLYNFCTLFDRNYASRGLALYHSLERVCRQDFRLTILCIDIETRDALARLALPKARLWLVEDLGDAELLEVRKSRPRREFCWTCPGPLMLALLDEAEVGDVVTYLDADLCFFADPAPVYDELGENDIYIHGHNFPERLKHFEQSAGIFNVGLVAVRKAEEGLACLRRWRAQCVALCELDPEKGHCGDQHYLNEWPSLYPRLVISRHPGVCLAPWNIEAHAVTERDGQILVDGRPLIFYHYHALKIISGRWWPWVLQPTPGYDFSDEQLRLIYLPYALLLYAAHYQLRRAGLRVKLPIVSVDEYLRLKMHRKDLLFIGRRGLVQLGGDYGQQRRTVANSSRIS